MKRKTELRYPNDPEAQKRWEDICAGVENAEKNRLAFIKNYEAGKINKTIFTCAKYLCYKQTSTN